MVSSSLVQLFAKGPIDKVMYGNPQVTFFKCVYKRPMNFATQYVYKNSNQKVDWGQTVTFKIPKEGDLLGGVYIRLDISDLKRTKEFFNIYSSSIHNIDFTDFFDYSTDDDSNSNSNRDVKPRIYGYKKYKELQETLSLSLLEPSQSKFTSFVNGIGSRIIEEVSIYSGSKLLERIPGEWIFMDNELHNNNNAKNMLYNSIGYKNRDFVIGENGDNIIDNDLIIPVPFFFTRDTGLHLPILAIHNELEVRVKLRTMEECTISSYNPAVSTSDIYLSYDSANIDFVEKNNNYLTWNSFTADQSFNQRINHAANTNTLDLGVTDLDLFSTNNIGVTVNGDIAVGNIKKYPSLADLEHDYLEAVNSNTTLTEAHTIILQRASFTLLYYLHKNENISGVNGRKRFANVTGSHDTDTGKRDIGRLFNYLFLGMPNGELEPPIRQIMNLPVGLRLPLQKRNEDVVGSINSMDIVYKYFHIDESQKIQFLSRRNTYIVPLINEISETSFDYSPGQIQQIPLELRNPVRYIIFVLQREKNHNDGDYFNYTKTHTLTKNKFGVSDGGNENELGDTQIDNILEEFNLSIENIDVLDTIPSKVLNNIEFLTKFKNSSNVLVYAYSFSLFPNDTNPSGSLNFSQVKDQFIKLKLHNNLELDSNEKILFRGYYSSYNIFTIDEGLAGFRFY